MQGWEFEGRITLVIPADEEKDARDTILEIWKSVRAACTDHARHILLADLALSAKAKRDLELSRHCAGAVGAQVAMPFLQEKPPEQKETPAGSDGKKGGRRRGRKAAGGAS